MGKDSRLKQVLVAWKDQDYRRNLGVQIKPDGCEFIEASTVAEVLAAIKADKHRQIIAVYMGLELDKETKAPNTTVPEIFAEIKKAREDIFLVVTWDAKDPQQKQKRGPRTDKEFNADALLSWPLTPVAEKRRTTEHLRLLQESQPNGIKETFNWLIEELSAIIKRRK